MYNKKSTTPKKIGGGGTANAAPDTEQSKTLERTMLQSYHTQRRTRNSAGVLIGQKSPAPAARTRKKDTATKASTVLEAKLIAAISAQNLPMPEREFYFHPVRQWRADFVYRAERILIECEGGTYSRRKAVTRKDGTIDATHAGEIGGWHTNPTAYEDDCRKYNAATLLGYRVLRFTTKQIASGEATQIIKEALAQFAVQEAQASPC